MIPLLVITAPFLWDKLFPILINSITGNPLLSGLLLMIIVFLMGQALRFPLEVQIISMFFGVWFVFFMFIPGLTTMVWIIAGIAIAIFGVYYFLVR